MKLILQGLNCTSCASKIENRIKNLQDINDVAYNFSTQILTFNLNDESHADSIVKKIEKIVHDLEPHVNVINTKNNMESNEINQINYNWPMVFRFLISFSIFIATLILEIPSTLKVPLLILSYFIIGYDIIFKAFNNIKSGYVFDENFLMVIATFGAIFLKEYHEANAVMLFYQFGEYLQDLAVDRSRQSISSLMDIKSEIAHLKQDFETKTVSPESLKIGDLIIVKPGEKVPIDGEIVAGSGTVNTIALTGESLPRKVSVGDVVLSGFINDHSPLTVKVTKLFENSAVAKILHLVEEASSKKAPTEKFISKFAKYYTPFVVYFAIALTLVPSLVFGQDFNTWFYRSLIFLVVSCPCALVVSIPLGFFSGIGIFSKNGILVKGGNHLEALTNIENIVFDKTGTLTEGIFKVNHIETLSSFSREEVLELAAHGESFSNHPIAKSILREYNGTIHNERVKDYTEHSGKGISLLYNDKKLLLGNEKLLKENNLTTRYRADYTVIYIAYNHEVIGAIEVYDKIKPGTAETIKKLTKSLSKKVFMLTGDNQQIAHRIADDLGIDTYYSELLPHEKVEKLESILKGGKTIFVGDGINDAPVLKSSTIGIAMGGLGSDAAIEASDIVLMNDDPLKIVDAFHMAKFTKKIVWQNIVFALSIKFFVLGLGAIGYASMKLAIFADVGVALLAILNALRVLRYKNKSSN